MLRDRVCQRQTLVCIREWSTTQEPRSDAATLAPLLGVAAWRVADILPFLLRVAIIPSAFPWAHLKAKVPTVKALHIAN